MINHAHKETLKSAMQVVRLSLAEKLSITTQEKPPAIKSKSNTDSAQYPRASQGWSIQELAKTPHKYITGSIIAEHDN